jgi:hypothetical protein
VGFLLRGPLVSSFNTVMPSSTTKWCRVSVFSSDALYTVKSHTFIQDSAAARGLCRRATQERRVFMRMRMHLKGCTPGSLPGHRPHTTCRGHLAAQWVAPRCRMGCRALSPRAHQDKIVPAFCHQQPHVMYGGGCIGLRTLGTRAGRTAHAGKQAVCWRVCRCGILRTRKCFSRFEG